MFLKAFYCATENLWVPLQALREIHDAEFEHRFLKNRDSKETASLQLRDSKAIEHAVLRDEGGIRLMASVDGSGLTIEEHLNRETNPRVIRIASPDQILIALLKERFASAVEFDRWLADKAISVDLKAGFDVENEEDYWKDLDELVESLGRESSRVKACKDSLDPKQSILIDFEHDERVVDADEVSLEEIDGYFAEGWIRVRNDFVRRPLVHTKTKPLLNIPARIQLDEFLFSKHQRRILRNNSDLAISVAAHSVSSQEEELFERHKARFVGTPPTSIYDIVPRISPTAIKKIEVRTDSSLLAVSYLCIGQTSAYSIYGMFDPSVESRSLGILTMLKEIELSIAEGKELYYLGYVFGFASFYDYKKQFHGLEYYDWKGNWTKQQRGNSMRGR